MFPYSVSSETFSANLYRLNDGRFQIVGQGKLSPFMQGVGYILIESEFADFLKTLDISQIEFKDAVIWDREPNVKNKNFKELIVKNTLYYSEDFEGVELEGLQMYLYGQESLFVSPQLKELLENSKFNYLTFKEGWSGFAA